MWRQSHAVSAFPSGVLMIEGVATIAVKNMIRIVPPVIITEEEIDDVIGRFVAAIKRAQDGYPRNIDFRQSSSLAIGSTDGDRRQ
jgi:hypothetical protein